MHTHDPHDSLALFHDRERRLHDAAAVERLREPSRVRTALAASLRRVADRLEPAALVRQPGGQH